MAPAWEPTCRRTGHASCRGIGSPWPAEARRAASGPPQMLVVLVSPFDAPVRTAEAMLLFPGVAILLRWPTRRLPPTSTQPTPATGRGDPGDPVARDALLARDRSLESCGPQCRHAVYPARADADRGRPAGRGCHILRTRRDLVFSWAYPLPGQSVLPLVAADDLPRSPDILSGPPRMCPPSFRFACSMPTEPPIPCTWASEG